MDDEDENIDDSDDPTLSTAIAKARKNYSSESKLKEEIDGDGVDWDALNRENANKMIKSELSPEEEEK